MAASLPRHSDGRTPQLTVAVLSYDGRHLLEVILPSLVAQRFRDFEVVVVDNGSTDGTEAWLRAQWPEIELIRLPQNVGVTPALNVCAGAGRGELVGLFNNDLELDPDCLGELVGALRANPSAGWASTKLLNFQRRDVIDGAGDVFTWSGTAGRRGHGERDVGQYDDPCAIFGACGGAAVYRRSALQRVGPFDEDFFAYYEDVDWNLRAQLAGFDCRYVPTAIAYHMGSATTGGGATDFAQYHMWRNAIWVLAKDLPAAALARHAPRLAVHQAANLALAIKGRTVRLWLSAVIDALRGIPKMLRKRRAVQASRSIDLRALEAVVGADGGRR
jgi:GT2 family glycosyltransferase